jgi:uncharacterized protein
LRTYLLKVYNYMAAGLALTGAVAYYGAASGFYATDQLLGLCGIGRTVTLFLIYKGESIARVFFISAGTFGATSLYDYTTRRDLSRFGSFLFMGLVGIILAGLVNIFLKSSTLQLTISTIGVIVFVSLTAYDTHRIKSIYVEGEDGATAGKKAILGALALYLDFLNLFLMLMQLLANRRQ